MFVNNLTCYDIKSLQSHSPATPEIFGYPDGATGFIASHTSHPMIYIYIYFFKLAFLLFGCLNGLPV